MQILRIRMKLKRYRHTCELQTNELLKIIRWMTNLKWENDNDKVKRPQGEKVIMKNLTREWQEEEWKGLKK
jgi:hypothetical protein